MRKNVLVLFIMLFAFSVAFSKNLKDNLIYSKADFITVNDDVEKVKKLVKKISRKYKKVGTCKQFASSLKKLMENENISGTFVKVKTVSNHSTRGNIWSDKHNMNISTNGDHQAIEVGGIVFDNMNPDGMSYTDWKKDLHSPAGHKFNEIEF